MVHFIADLEAPSGRNSPKPPPKEPYHVSEPPFEGYHEVDNKSYSKSSGNDAIVIDNGKLRVHDPCGSVDAEFRQAPHPSGLDGLSNQSLHWSFHP